MRPKRLSHRTIVELLGGMTVLAPVLGLPKRNTVAHWKKRDRGIPPVYWAAVARFAQSQGFDITVTDIERTSPSPKLRRRIAA